jgi:hypothetical protein
VKLNIVPAKTGITWVKLGIQTFFKQPLALGGLFFMFMAAASIVGLIPIVGSLLTLALLPAFTLGMMVATLEAQQGKFPMPRVLLSAFRGDKTRAKAMWMLGAQYAVVFSAVMGLIALMDGGEFAKMLPAEGKITKESLEQITLPKAVWLGAPLYLLMSLLFWHAPALVFWHGVPPVKALFFSLVACLRNWRAYALFGLAWMMATLLAASVVQTLVALFSSPANAASMSVSVTMVVVSTSSVMFMTAIYFTFRDSFVHEPHPGDPSVPKK